ncbi:MAG: DSD1 family PLP-dependent enzyme [Gammaproteobacteria bacterium]|nr:DSD1 family PLP-dependent enzyme [Gammaproteobacteria bacterium]MYD79607.1 DSD1 family PLP-dependent enzyme [Gammaproteobacteria bacterium]
MLNRHLLNVSGGSRHLQTPALVVDLEKLRTNLDRMQARCEHHTHVLRPHTKTHKCVAIAKLQVERGAVGICCAKLSEAEAMSRGGLENILVTSPVVTDEGIRRAISLSRTTKELILTIDNKSVARLTDAMAKSAQTELNVIMDIDPGMHRTGIPLGDEGLSLAHALKQDCPSLRFRGVQFYSGDLMHVLDYSVRRNRYLARSERLWAFLRELHEMGIDTEIVTGGGTGSYEFDFESDVMTELQAGSYAFMDRQYLEIESGSGGTLEFDPSLFVFTTVVSSNHSHMATTDAGLKSFATDDKTPLIVDGAPRESHYSFMGDEHGAIHWAIDDCKLDVGSLVSTVVPHCDPTINLYNELHVIHRDKLVDIWPIEARGHTQ